MGKATKKKRATPRRKTGKSKAASPANAPVRGATEREESARDSQRQYDERMAAYAALENAAVQRLDEFLGSVKSTQDAAEKALGDALWELRNHARLYGQECYVHYHSFVLNRVSSWHDRMRRDALWYVMEVIAASHMQGLPPRFNAADWHLVKQTVASLYNGIKNREDVQPDYTVTASVRDVRTPGLHLDITMNDARVNAKIEMSVYDEHGDRHTDKSCTLTEGVYDAALALRFLLTAPGSKFTSDDVIAYVMKHRVKRRRVEWRQDLDRQVSVVRSAERSITGNASEIFVGGKNSLSTKLRPENVHFM